MKRTMTNNLGSKLLLFLYCASTTSLFAARGEEHKLPDAKEEAKAEITKEIGKVDFKERVEDFNERVDNAGLADLLIYYKVGEMANLMLEHDRAAEEYNKIDDKQKPSILNRLVERIFELDLSDNRNEAVSTEVTDSSGRPVFDSNGNKIYVADTLADLVDPKKGTRYLIDEYFKSEDSNNEFLNALKDSFVAFADEEPVACKRALLTGLSGDQKPIQEQLAALLSADQLDEIRKLLDVEDNDSWETEYKEAYAQRAKEIKDKAQENEDTSGTGDDENNNNNVKPATSKAEPEFKDLNQMMREAQYEYHHECG